MAQVKKANVPPTHPTVWAGLGLALVGLLVAMYAYTGTRVYDITFALVALVGGLLALAGILTAAWGRSIMAARASRSRRGLMEDDARKAAARGTVETLAEQPPTVAAPAEKKRFKLPIPQRRPKEPEKAAGANVFAFKRRASPASERPAEPRDDPRDPAVAAGLAAPAETVEVSLAPAPVLERVTLKCPQCATQFTAEGVRPLTATCPSCAFSATI